MSAPLESQRPPEALLLYASGLIHQAIDLLRDSVTQDDQLSAESTLIPGGTVGKHLRSVWQPQCVSFSLCNELSPSKRHIHDHYRLLLDHTQAGATADRELDYDVRSRNLPMETSRDAALQMFQDLEGRLEKGHGETKLKVVLGDEEVVMATSFEREASESYPGVDVPLSERLAS
jgi:hypothetical protein